MLHCFSKHLQTEDARPKNRATESLLHLTALTTIAMMSIDADCERFDSFVPSSIMRSRMSSVGIPHVPAP